MINKRITVLLIMVVVTGVLCAGCVNKIESKNTPPQSYTEWQKKYDRTAYDANHKKSSRAKLNVKRKKLPPQSYEDWQKYSVER